MSTTARKLNPKKRMTKLTLKWTSSHSKRISRPSQKKANLNKLFTNKLPHQLMQTPMMMMSVKYPVLIIPLNLQICPFLLRSKNFLNT
jgi:hypothetical protein